MQQLSTLSRDADINEAVRYGDIYAVLITHNVRKKNYKKVDQAFCVHQLLFNRRRPFVTNSKNVCPTST